MFAERSGRRWVRSAGKPQMEIRRGDIWWADLVEPRGSEPGFHRPLLIVQADGFNRSRIATVLAVVLTTNLRLVDAPGNVLIPAKAAGLPQDSVANVSQVVTLDRDFLDKRVGKVPTRLMAAVDGGLKLVLDLL
jgi:mRNA interferase MazF